MVRTSMGDRARQATRLQKAALVALGVFGTLLVVELSMRTAGWALLTLQNRRNKVAAREKGVVTIMCLGESTTARGGADSWPAQLEEVLNARKLGLHFNVVNRATEGVQTDTLLAQLGSNLDKYQPSIVVTMMGVNDGAQTVQYDRTVRSVFALFLHEIRLYKLFRYLCAGLVTPAAAATLEKPGDRERYYRLVSDGRKLEWDGRYSEAAVIFEEAIKLLPDDAAAYVELGQNYRARRDYAEAEDLFEKALQVDPKNYSAFEALGMSYRERGDLEKVFELSQRILKSGIENDVFYGFIGTAYRERGLLEEADEFFKKAEKFRSTYYSPATRHNYGKIADTLQTRGIRLVAMQYPLWEVDSLMHLLAPRRGIEFVSNVRNFKQALAREPFAALFTDNFAGAFGHATRKGNRLIAENVADTIARILN